MSSRMYMKVLEGERAGEKSEALNAQREPYRLEMLFVSAILAKVSTNHSAAVTNRSPLPCKSKLAYCHPTRYDVSAGKKTMRSLNDSHVDPRGWGDTSIKRSRYCNTPQRKNVVICRKAAGSNCGDNSRFRVPTKGVEAYGASWSCI